MLLAVALLATPAFSAEYYEDPGFCSTYEGLTPSERAGCQIWFYATADNDRFHTCVFQQRLGVMIGWYRVLNTKERGIVLRLGD